MLTVVCLFFLGDGGLLVKTVVIRLPPSCKDYKSFYLHYDRALCKYNNIIVLDNIHKIKNRPILKIFVKVSNLDENDSCNISNCMILYALHDRIHPTTQLEKKCNFYVDSTK